MRFLRTCSQPSAGKLNPTSFHYVEASWIEHLKEFIPLNGRSESKSSYLIFTYAPVAQLDRASDYGSEGLGFESLQVYKMMVDGRCKRVDG